MRLVLERRPNEPPDLAVAQVQRCVDVPPVDVERLPCQWAQGTLELQALELGFCFLVVVEAFLVHSEEVERLTHLGRELLQFCYRQDDRAKMIDLLLPARPRSPHQPCSISFRISSSVRPPPFVVAFGPSSVSMIARVNGSASTAADSH